MAGFIGEEQVRRVKERSDLVEIMGQYAQLQKAELVAPTRILHIAERTDPLSDRLVPSGGSVRSVLEVIGGTARNGRSNPHASPRRHAGQA